MFHFLARRTSAVARPVRLLGSVHTRLLSIGFSLILLSLAASGCGGDDYADPVPVSGKVTLDGQPLGGGTVRFVPADREKAKPGRGEIQTDGSYKATTDTENDGLIPAEYSVFFDNPETSEVTAKDEGGGVNIPPKYLAPGTSGLTLSVTGETSSADFVLAN